MAPDTRQRILDHALNVVNERGLEALGIREIARDLELSPGNVSYHFKKREDLIRALSEPLGAGNRERLGTAATTVPEVLELFRGILNHQHAYRGLVLSLPHIMEAFPDFREWYQANQAERQDNLRRLLERLRASGELVATDREADRLQAHLGFVARFWMSEARASFRDEPLDTVVGHYLALIADLMGRHAPHRASEIAPYLEGLLTPRTVSGSGKTR